MRDIFCHTCKTDIENCGFVMYSCSCCSTEWCLKCGSKYALKTIYPENSIDYSPFAGRFNCPLCHAMNYFD